MAVFWVMAALMTAVAVAFVLVPLLRARSPAGPTSHGANLAVLRGQRREIDADAANGLLAAAARDEALAELVERAERDLEATPATVADTDARRPWVAAAIAGIAIPALSFGLYLALGTPNLVGASAAASGAAAPDEQQIVAMVESLAAKVRTRPDDAQGWALLARSMGALGRFRESADAYEHLLTLVPRNAQILADYADVLGMVQGRTLVGRPYELAREALALDPHSHKALALAGTAAMDAGDFPAALGHWRALAAELPPGSDDERQVEAIVAEIGLKAAAAGKALPAAPASIARTKPAEPAASSVSGSVTVSPSLAGRISAGETLFVYARAEGGSRMPLAVMRVPARKAPTAFALDDSMAMTPATRISGASAIRVEARISKSGMAAPQPGDLVGSSAVVKPGARDVAIVIDKALP